VKDKAVRSSTFTLASADGLALFVYRWLPEAAPKAVVQIAHGLVEHAGRYARLAKALIALATRSMPAIIAAMAGRRRRRRISAFLLSGTAGANA
jgi:hypothetical protein